MVSLADAVAQYLTCAAVGRQNHCGWQQSAGRNAWQRQALPSLFCLWRKCSSPGGQCLCGPLFNGGLSANGRLSVSHRASPPCTPPGGHPLQPPPPPPPPPPKAVGQFLPIRREYGSQGRGCAAYAAAIAVRRNFFWRRPVPPQERVEPFSAWDLTQRAPVMCSCFFCDAGSG